MIGVLLLKNIQLRKHSVSCIISKMYNCYSTFQSSIRISFTSCYAAFHNQVHFDIETVYLNIGGGSKLPGSSIDTTYNHIARCIISLSVYDILEHVVPIRISLVGDAVDKEATETRAS